MTDDEPMPRSSLESSVSGSGGVGHWSLSVAPPAPVISPSGSLLRSSASLERLTQKLGELQDESDEDFGASTGSVSNLTAAGGGGLNCCCGQSNGCKVFRGRTRLEEKLKLSGEIGDTLLLRYESMERNYTREIARLTEQLEVRKTALADSIRRVNNLERAASQGKDKYSALVKKHEELEKRYTQSVHDQSLTQQSLSHLRSELSDVRRTMNRQSVSLAVGVGAEGRLTEAELRGDTLQDELDVERRNVKEEERRRKRAEARISELEEQLQASVRESEEMRMGRKRDAEDLLANAKCRLDDLHSQLAATYHQDSPEETPEYQRTLESLVASNTLLKHDTTNLAGMLALSQEQARNLRDEVEELRAMVGMVGQRLRPPANLASELSRSANGRASPIESPLAGAEGVAEFPGLSGRPARSRMSYAPPGHSMSLKGSRRASLVPSVTSPGLGMGPIGEYSGSVQPEEGSRTLSPLTQDEATSPGFPPRVSPNGSSIGYVLNGMPKRNSIGLGRPGMRRNVSVDRRSVSSRPFSPQSMTGIAESEPETQLHSEPNTPAGDYFRAADLSRRRRSLMLQRFDSISTSAAGWPEISSVDDQTLVNPELNEVQEDSEMEDRTKPTVSPNKRKVHRRTLLLLTQSTGVQTDAMASIGRAIVDLDLKEGISLPDSRRGSVNDSAAGTADQSDLGLDTESRQRHGQLSPLLDHLQKILSKIRTADIATLNKRLRKHKLPGDVPHLSRTTLRHLQQEIITLRDTLKPTEEEPTISRRELNLLLKLLRDVFMSLIDLQALTNDMVIDHHIAKRLNKAAFREEGEEETAGLAKQMAGGLGWVAAPLTKFFVTSPAEDAVASPAESVSSKNGRLQAVSTPAHPRAAPKQSAIAAATTTHISVEFGGTGMVRRAASALPTTSPGTIVADLPPSPSDPRPDAQTVRATPADSSAVNTPVDETAAVQTLRRSKSRGNRAELMGIFAGASRPKGPVIVPPVPDLPEAPAAGGRVPSARFFSDRTIRPLAADQAAVGTRRRLPSSIDGMIDPDSVGEHGMGSVGVGEAQPPLLQRTLRRRGLSDSSIRSTVMLQADEDRPNLAVTAGSAQRQGAYSKGTAGAIGPAGRKGYLESFTSRFYGFKGDPVAAKPAVQAPQKDAIAPLAVAAREEPESIGSTKATLPVPIVEEPQSSKPTPIPSASSASSHSQAGFLSILANSFVVGSESATSFEDSESLMRTGVSHLGVRANKSSMKGWTK